MGLTVILIRYLGTAENSNFWFQLLGLIIAEGAPTDRYRALKGTQRGNRPVSCYLCSDSTQSYWGRSSKFLINLK
jgi:hypothetical protein